MVLVLGWALLAGSGLGLSGCAHSAQPGTAPVRAASAVPQVERHTPKVTKVDGVYDWVARGTDRQGDLHLEQEEWHIEQDGTRIAGYYDRSITFISRDDRPYRCNQKLSFTNFTRVRIAGSIEGERVQLRETEYMVRPGPCDDGARNLVEYRGVAREGTIELSWGLEQRQHLQRRTGAGRPSLAATIGVTEESLRQGASSAVDQSVSLGGTWVWELRSVDADGDQRIEREVWELREGPDGLDGHYDRTVTRVRVGGVFACNQKERYETTTRYQLHGQRFGDRFTLVETNYQSPSSPCDTGTRRLDTYRGTVSRGGEELVLSWGPGTQLLRRAPQ